MRDSVLIDSHILIWLLFEPQRVSGVCRQAVEGATAVFVSNASLWELILKANKGLLKYKPRDILNGYKAMQLQCLNISEQHMLAIADLKLSHKDPFDTMLVAQAVCEGMVLVTADSALIDSPYKTIDARV